MAKDDKKPWTKPTVTPKPKPEGKPKVQLVGKASDGSKLGVTSGGVYIAEDKGGTLIPEE
jgi:hypothetical protein